MASMLVKKASRLTKLNRRDSRSRLFLLIFSSCLLLCIVFHLSIIKEINSLAGIDFNGISHLHLSSFLPSHIYLNPERENGYNESELQLNFVVPFFYSSDIVHLNASIFELFTSLESADYDGDRVALHGYILSKGDHELVIGMTSLMNSLSWSHGKMDVRVIQPCPLLCIDSILNPTSESSFLAFAIVSQTTPVHHNWYRFASESRRHFNNHPDVFAISTGPPSMQTLYGIKEPIVDSELFLWTIAPTNQIFIPAHMSKWKTFINWRQRQRGDWYIWPTALEPQARKDSKWAHFNGTVTGCWSSWLTRFSALYNVYTLYPTLPNPDRSVVEINKSCNCVTGKISKISEDGADITNRRKSKILESSIDQIYQFAQSYDGAVSLTLVNEPYLEIVRSWTCNVDVGGFRPPGIVWIATDDKSYHELKDSPNSYAVRLNEINGGKDGPKFARPGYWLLMLERAFLVRDLINRGLKVFLFETDQVWLRDPMPFVNRLLDSSQEVDLIATMDVIHDLGGNFLFLNPTLSMRKVYSQVCKQFEDGFNRKKVSTLHKDSIVALQNDQTLLSKMVLYDQRFRAKFPIVLRILDRELFVCGQWYKDQQSHYKSRRAKSPIMINNNWVAGISEKIIRLKRFGHWFVHNGICNGTAVQAAIEENERNAFALQFDRDSQTTGGLRKYEGSDVPANWTTILNIVQAEVKGAN